MGLSENRSNAVKSFLNDLKDVMDNHGAVLCVDYDAQTGAGLSVDIVTGDSEIDSYGTIIIAGVMNHIGYDVESSDIEAAIDNFKLENVW